VDEWEPNPDYPAPKEGEPPLHRAAREGDAEAIRRLVAEGADPDEVFDMRLDPGGRNVFATPLMVAAGSGDGATVETVRLLLDLGADPGIEAEDGTAVSYAASGLGWNYRPGGDAERLRLLLDAGGRPPSDPEEANRMLCAAARSGNLDTLRQITRLGLDVKGYWNKERAEAWHRGLNASMESSRRAMMDDMGIEFDVDFTEELDRTMFESSTSAPYSSQIPFFGAAQSGSAGCVRLWSISGPIPKSGTTARGRLSGMPVPPRSSTF